MGRHSEDFLGWHSRGYLPHFDKGLVAQSVTIRLFDSLPALSLERLRREVKLLPDRDRRERLKEKIDLLIDAGYGSCYLRREAIAGIIKESLRYRDGRDFWLHCWCIMPNHVHFLASFIRPMDRVIREFKSYTASMANKALGRVGSFWCDDYFDRYIRDDDHFGVVADYIEMNPVRAGLCKHAHEWPWSGSAGLS
jgi:REP element-mobilizing transposase RayT